VPSHVLVNSFDYILNPGGLKQIVRLESLDNQVMFAGYLDRTTELQDCYCAADAFVFASHTETQGLVLLEAMAV
jgi:1,2-diacylglycerol 3-alpha-glucosyltransferase